LPLDGLLDVAVPAEHVLVHEDAVHRELQRGGLKPTPTPNAQLLSLHIKKLTYLLVNKTASIGNITKILMSFDIIQTAIKMVPSFTHW
jgi:hypothetical protein